MTDRNGQDRGKPGEMEGGGVSPVVGDIERTTALGRRGNRPGGKASAGEAEQVLAGLVYPLARDDMVREAAGKGAGRDLLDRLAHLPNRLYESAEDAGAELQRSLPAPRAQPGA